MKRLLAGSPTCGAALVLARRKASHRSLQKLSPAKKVFLPLHSLMLP